MRTSTETRHEIVDHALAHRGGVYNRTTGAAHTEGFALTVAVYDTVTEADLDLAVHNALLWVETTDADRYALSLHPAGDRWEVAAAMVTPTRTEAIRLAALLDADIEDVTR